MATPATSRTPAQMFALVFGVIYLLVGIAGFFVASEFTGGSADDKLIAFPVNHLHNIIHLLIGGSLIFGSTRADLAKMMNLANGVVLALVAVLGFLDLDFMKTLINDHGAADDFLHLVTAILAIYFGTAGASTTGAASTPAA